MRQSSQRMSFGPKNNFEEFFDADIPHSDDYYDLLEYKYQLDLIHTQVELAQCIVQRKLGARKQNVLDAA